MSITQAEEEMRTKIDKLAETIKKLEVTKLKTDEIYDYLQECAQASEPSRVRANPHPHSHHHPNH